MLNSPLEISNAFNDHFASIADAIIENSQSHGNDFIKLADFINSKLPHDVSFDIPDFSVDYVRDSLRKLNVKKGTGLDGLQPKFLVMAADIIAPSLTWIFNFSLHSAVVPDIWKIAKVIPLHKKGSITDPNNYRPISILPALSKIFERHIHTHLMSHLDSNNLLHCHYNNNNIYSHLQIGERMNSKNAQ